MKALTGLIILVVSTVAIGLPARADTQQACTISSIDFKGGTGQGMLTLKCAQSNNVSYYAFYAGLTPPNCPSYQIDFLKIWQALATTSLLGQRTGTLWYSTPVNPPGCSSPIITDFILQ
jgi:hypothetical protein